MNVVGNTTYTSIESETVRIQDNIIHLNSQVSGDNSNTQNLTNDIGWVGQTTISGTQSYVGTVWDYSKGKIKFLEGNSTIDNEINDSSKSIGIIVGNTIIDSTLSVVVILLLIINLQLVVI